eukprot:3762524-Pyramimonas_sp.AAC.1
MALELAEEAPSGATPASPRERRASRPPNPAASELRLPPSPTPRRLTPECLRPWESMILTGWETAWPTTRASSNQEARELRHQRKLWAMAQARGEMTCSTT